jgi:putative solute:sodium symporter small subunit
VQLAALTVAATTAFALTPWLFAALEGRTVLGMPLPYFLLVLALPLAILVAIFWFARRQASLDHRYDVTGSQA